jgi:5-methylcytosine-specific restriction endonuclease McrA
VKRKDIPRTRCSNTMTEAAFTTFVKSQLRSASRRWKPISDTLREAKVSRGVYKCASCLNNVPVSIKVNGKRIKNITVDHIKPIVDPVVGFTTWDDFVNRLFTERENLQALCGDCHDKKTLGEKNLATERRKKEKDQSE